MILVFYVDDNLLATNNPCLLHEIKIFLAKTMIQKIWGNFLCYWRRGS